MANEKQFNKLVTLEDDPKLAIFDELQEINDSLKGIIEGIKASKTDEVSIANPDDLKLDISPLEANFEALKTSIQGVIDTVKGIKGADLSKVESLLKNIAEKKSPEQQKVDFGKVVELLDNILFAVQSNVASPDVSISMTPLEMEMKAIQNVLFELKDITEKNGQKEMVLPFHGVETVGVKNAIGTKINPATSEGQAGGAVSTANSSTTPLGISGVFTGTAEDITDYSSVFIQVFSDKASATDGLSMEFSPDGTNWDETHKYTVTANEGLDAVHAAHAKYFRVVYTNGGTAQTVFRLQTLFKKTSPPLMADRLGNTIGDEESAALVRSVIAGKKPDGTYTNVQTTAGGNLKVSIEEQNGTANLAQETGGNLDTIAAANTPYATQIQVDSVTSTISYIGKAAIGSATSSAVWQIQKLNETTGTIITWADGSAAFNQIWDNRESLSYS